MPKKGSSKFTPKRIKIVKKEKLSARRNSASISNANQAIISTASDRGESTSNLEQEASTPTPIQQPKILIRRKAG
jgi:hypothetical protein